MTDRVTNGDLHHDIGVLEARLDAMEKVQVENSQTLKEIRDTLLLVRGGRKVLGWMAAAAGAAGAGMSWLVEHVAFK